MNTKIWTDELMNELMDFRANHTLRQCGERYGVTPERIRQIMHKKARKMNAEGCSWDEALQMCRLPVDDWMPAQPNA